MELVDLPCVAETRKTADNVTLYKSADVGQMIIVYESVQKAKEITNRLKIFDSVDSHELTSGLTPPTFEITRRRFKKRRDKQVLLFFFFSFLFLFLVVEKFSKLLLLQSQRRWTSLSLRGFSWLQLFYPQNTTDFSFFFFLFCSKGFDQLYRGGEQDQLLDEGQDVAVCGGGSSESR
jgi:hypothetical protein